MKAEKLQKVIRDGKVAVLISRGFGAGWYSWNSECPQIVFHPLLVEMVEQGRRNEITPEFILEHLGEDNVYTGGADQLTIEWLDVGTHFTINEYDGSESIMVLNDLELIA